MTCHNQVIAYSSSQAHGSIYQNLTETEEVVSYITPVHIPSSGVSAINHYYEFAELSSETKDSKFRQICVPRMTLPLLLCVLWLNFLYLCLSFFAS